MKTIFKTTLLLSLATFTFIGCNDDDNNCDDLESRRILLSSEVAMAVEPRLQDQHIADGQRLSLFVTPTGVTNQLLYSNVNVISDGTGALASNTIMYYPIEGTHIDFYGVHPYNANAVLTDSLDFSVQQDQSVLKNYYESDLLHATHFDQARTTSAVRLNFAHRLSKLEFVVKNTDGLNLSQLSSVTILNTRPSTTINIINGGTGTARGVAPEIITYGLPAPANAGTSVDNIHGIIVPQVVPANTQLFRITVGAQSYIYTTTTDFAFLAGNRHVVTLTIAAGQVSLEATITPWITGGSIGGGVVPEP